MPTTRVQVQDPTGARRLSPRSSPLDSFVQPAAAQKVNPNELTQLAGALSDLQPTLARWAQREKVADTEREVKQAAADRLRNKASFAEATQRGLIPAGANPYYVQEYKRMDGELDAQSRYHGFLSERWQKSGLYEQDFPTERHAADAFSTFVEQTRGEFLESVFGDGPIDPSYAEGFNKRRGGIESSLSGQQVSERLSRNELKFEANTSELIGELLGGDSETLGADIAALGRTQKAEFGISNEKFNELVLDQVVADSVALALAGDYEDAMNILDTLDVVPTSAGNFLGGTGAAKEAKNAAAIKITQLQQQRETYDWSKQTREWALEDRPASVSARNFQALRQAQTLEDWDLAATENRESDERDLAYMDTMMEIVANPTQDFTLRWERLASSEATAPLVPTLQAALAARISATERVNEDEGQLAQLKLDVMRGQASPETVVGMVANRTLSYAHSVDILEDWSRATNNAAVLSEQRREVRDVISKGRSGLSKSISGSDQFSSPATNQLAFQATLEYDDLMADYLTTNPQASLRDIRRERAEIIKLLLSDPQYSSETLSSNFERPEIRTPSEARNTRTQGLVAPQPNPFNADNMVE